MLYCIVPVQHIACLGHFYCHADINLSPSRMVYLLQNEKRFSSASPAGSFRVEYRELNCGVDETMAGKRLELLLF